ncbi:MAG: Uma2 family endonuclease [Gemmataceae bacterium]|nr:Uma2 family endonuclease [Gemmataceae bacterium]
MSSGAVKEGHLFGPESAGTLMTPREFDRAEFVEGYRYELIHGVLVVSPIPQESERDPNDELGYWLRKYGDTHPEGAALDVTLHEQTVRTKQNRRLADRVIWAGLGRLPRRRDVPTIIVDFISKAKKDRPRDFEEKRAEYVDLGVKEYWVLDRFRRNLTAHSPPGRKARKQVYREGQAYVTELLPGFEVPLDRLFALADRWAEPRAD